jgi:excisionase family DNA binding protein
MQHVVIIPETEWRQFTARLDQLEAAEQARQSPPPPPDKVLTTREAAAYIGLSEDALRRARRAGRLPGVRLNEKDWGFRQSVLDCYPRRYHRATHAQAA